MSRPVLKHHVPHGKRTAMGMSAQQYPRVRWMLSVLALLATAACGPAAGSATSGSRGPDAPVPAGVARETVQLIVDLEPSADCEEDFDLALYEERGVEFIEWDDAERPCAGRAVSIRFLPERLPRKALLDRIKDLTTAVRDGAGAGERSSRKKP